MQKIKKNLTLQHKQTILNDGMNAAWHKEIVDYVFNDPETSSQYMGLKAKDGNYELVGDFSRAYLPDVSGQFQEAFLEEKIMHNANACGMVLESKAKGKNAKEIVFEFEING